MRQQNPTWLDKKHGLARYASPSDEWCSCAPRLQLLVSSWFRTRRDLQDDNVIKSRAFGQAESGDQQVAEWIEKRTDDAINALETRHRLIDCG
jgi:hypothetical protein